MPIRIIPLQAKFRVISKVFGVDIGGSGVKGAPVDVKKGSLIADRYKIPTPETLTPLQMADTVNELLAKFSWDGPVGIGFPALIRKNTAIGYSNLHPDWSGMNLKKFFKQHLQQKVQIVNDADAAGLAEVEFGAGKNKSGLVILCTFGTGIGSAMFYDGKLLPSTELGQLSYKGKRIELYAADSARKREGLSYEEWGKRVNEYFQHVELLFSPKLFIIGGGASKKLDLFKDQLHLETPLVPAEMLNVAGTVGAALGYKAKKEMK